MKIFPGLFSKTKSLLDYFYKMTLVNSESLSNAIEVQKRCYKFLQLIKFDQLDLTRGWALSNPHKDSTTEAKRFKELIVAHFMNLPEDTRPVSTSEKDLDEFANFFVSFLFCSFDIIANPRLVQLSGPASDAYCWCELCARLTNAPDLKLKKVTNWDKSIANSLEAEAVRRLISSEKFSISEKKVNDVLKDPEFIETRALVAYGIELIRRCKGEDTDSSSLVLWRRFAWEKGGTPKKDFVLTSEMIEDAESRLISRLKTLSD